jgi:hypothetical protein
MYTSGFRVSIVVLCPGAEGDSGMPQRSLVCEREQ